MKNDINEPEVKMLRLGQSSLSDAENLSLIIRGKDSLNRANILLKKVNYSYGELVKLSYNDFINEGLSNTQALSIISSFELSKRKNIAACDLTHIRYSRDIYKIMYPLVEDLEYEEFWIILVNRSNNVINKFKISQGGISGTVIDVRIIMKTAISYLASGIICCHNHPSGNLRPSESDITNTRKIKEAALLLDISLLDHIIIANKTYLSFADDGLL